MEGRGNFANYDSHFIPVVPANPANPNETVYLPTKPNQKAVYHELVVFDAQQCLPRFVVTLQADLISSPRAPALMQDKKNVALWTVEQVLGFVATLGLRHSYNQVLDEHGVDGVVLLSMTKEDWKEVGVKALGDRRKIILAVKAFADV